MLYNCSHPSVKNLTLENVSTQSPAWLHRMQWAKDEEIGEIDVMVFNVGANVPMSILDTSSRKFSKIWEMACFAGFLNGREAAKHMIKRNKGTIIFTGATASMRGGANFAAFASAKHGLRALAQSMARELGPKSIHVCHVALM